MRQRGFWPWSIQTGPFAACKSNCVPKNFYFFPHPPRCLYTASSHKKQFLYYGERGRKEASRLQIGTGNSIKGSETRGFLTLEHSNWTICRLLSRFCYKFFPLFHPALDQAQIICKPFIYYGERGRKEAAGLQIGKRNSLQIRHRGFWHWGLQTGQFAAC